MKLCPDCDPRGLCCDHCAYYMFNGDEEGRYTGDGFCRFHKENREPWQCCDEYFCFQILRKDDEVR